MFCPECGHRQSLDDARFCTRCGIALELASEIAEAARRALPERAAPITAGLPPSGADVTEDATRALPGRRPTTGALL